MFLFKWIRSLQHSQDQLSVLLNGVCFIRLQVAFVFPALPPSSSRSLSLFRASISFVWSLFSLPSIISTGEFSSRLTFIISFSSPVDSIIIFGSDYIIFLSSSVFLARSPLASLSFRSAQDISGDSSVFQLIRGCHLIQIFQLFRCIIYLFNKSFPTVLSLQWALTHRSFFQDLT